MMRFHSTGEYLSGESREWHFAQGPVKIARPRSKSSIRVPLVAWASSRSVTGGGGLTQPAQSPASAPIHGHKIAPSPRERPAGFLSDICFGGWTSETDARDQADLHARLFRTVRRLEKNGRGRIEAAFADAQVWPDVELRMGGCMPLFQ